MHAAESRYSNDGMDNLLVGFEHCDGKNYGMTWSESGLKK